MIKFDETVTVSVHTSEVIEEGILVGNRILTIQMLGENGPVVDIIVPANLPEVEEYIGGLVSDIRDMSIAVVEHMVNRLNEEMIKKVNQENQIVH